MKHLSEFSDYHGIDSSNEISLFEYDLIVKLVDPEKKEYHCIYKVEQDLFESASITEAEVNSFIEGKKWMDEKTINSFLVTMDCTKEEWLQSSFVCKLFDLLNYFGFMDIMGSTYYGFEVIND